MHVLYLEDFELDVKLMRQYMDSMHYKFVSVSTLAEAWEYLQHKQPDVFLVDVLIGKDTAYDLIDTAAKQNLAKHIVAVTARALPYEQQYYLALGCDSVISKPFTVDDIERVLRKLA